MEFKKSQIERYARHIALREVSEQGQAKLLNSKVLVIGAGGLGSAVIVYLAAAGVGVIGVIDDDKVDLSNLQRQVIHTTASIGQAKVESAQRAVAAINPDVRFISHSERLTAANAMELISRYDIIADCSDNFATRFLANDACYLAGRTLVSGTVLRFDGQVCTFKAHLAKGYPCYRCIYREPPPLGQIPSCAEVGIFGAQCGVIGSLQATEVLKELLEIGTGLAGQLLVYDGLSASFRKIKAPNDPGCPLCGHSPSIRDLSIHG